MHGCLQLALILLLQGTVLPAALAQTVEGRVTDAISGAAIGSVTVMMVPDGGPSIGKARPYRTETDADGHFHIEGIAEGIYKPLYNARGYRAVTPDSGVDIHSITVSTARPPGSKSNCSRMPSSRGASSMAPASP